MGRKKANEKLNRIMKKFTLTLKSVSSTLITQSAFGK